MTALTCHLVLDACRRDYITPERTPFLSALMRKSVTASVHSPPGFTQRTAMFTGQFPDTSGNFQAFGYDPANSPFRWVKKLGPLAGLYRARKVFFPMRVAFKRISRMTSGQYHTDPAWIPGRFLPSFAVVEDSKPVFEPDALPATSVFDLCREHGRTFRYLAHPVSGDDRDIFERILAAYAEPSPPELVVAQFSNLDERGHHKGPPAPPGLDPAPHQSEADKRVMADTLREIDDRCKAIHDAMEATGRTFRFVIVGDHGMAPVRRHVDILAAAKKTGLKAGKDYVLFVNSTIANVWYETPEARTKLRSALEAVPGGRFLAPQERKDLRIAFDHRRYGDDLWAADPGTLLWPDYFHVVEHDIQGMHGYIDKSEEGTGVLILRGSDVEARELGDRSLVDVFPTLCRSLDLPVPPSNEGASVLGRT